ncbi:hypothetical protein F5I97DRAFT_977911 [Phlebopus sp. FC_14]|nr:hypothetical protein F5I97DRAFT_977911 [Phlebopus sp. FC_14]
MTVSVHYSPSSITKIVMLQLWCFLVSGDTPARPLTSFLSNGPTARGIKLIGSQTTTKSSNDIKELNVRTHTREQPVHPPQENRTNAVQIDNSRVTC